VSTHPPRSWTAPSGVTRPSASRPGLQKGDRVVVAGSWPAPWLPALDREDDTERRKLEVAIEELGASLLTNRQVMTRMTSL